jgi:hypothetical protein
MSRFPENCSGRPDSNGLSNTSVRPVPRSSTCVLLSFAKTIDRVERGLVTGYRDRQSDIR